MHGMETTVGVPLRPDEHARRAAGWVRGTKRKALIVVDMPFGSYEEKPEHGVPKRREDHEGDGLRRGEARRRQADGRRPSVSSSSAAIPVMAHTGAARRSRRTLMGAGSRHKGARRRAGPSMRPTSGGPVAEAGAFALVWLPLRGHGRARSAVADQRNRFPGSRPSEIEREGSELSTVADQSCSRTCWG